jgi:hypothetical protein
VVFVAGEEDGFGVGGCGRGGPRAGLPLGFRVDAKGEGVECVTVWKGSGAKWEWNGPLPYSRGTDWAGRGVEFKGHSQSNCSGSEGNAPLWVTAKR